MGGGAWQATVHGVAKSQTRLNDLTWTLVEHTDYIAESFTSFVESGSL